MRKRRRSIIAVFCGGIPLLTIATCDPDTNAFKFLRIDDLDDIVEEFLDEYDDYDDYYDDYDDYWDCYDCYYW